MEFTTLTYDEVSVSPKKEVEVSVKSTALINSLISNPEEALEKLRASAASIDLSQISIDDYGTVIIKNDELVEKIKKFIASPVRAAGGNNCDCSVF